jgi:AcrR family transcriptional regulator
VTVPKTPPPRSDDTPPRTDEAAEPEVDGESTEVRPRRRVKKEEIIGVATRLFAQRGYEGASMGDLAELVGLRKASLFHHFESKDVLYAAVLSELLREIEDAIRRALASEGSLPERLDAMTDAITEMLVGNPHAARLLVREAMDWGPVMQAELSDQIQSVLAAAVSFARAGQSAGVFDPDLDPEQIIISMIGVHFMPFMIDRTVERFLGTSPFEEAFLERRRCAVRDQNRRLVLVRGK